MRASAKNTSEKAGKGIDKIKAYKWEMQDTPGEFCFIDKKLINIDPEYQRKASDINVMRMAANWSWAACGTITIGERDGRYWAIDGQNRVLAAMKRSDIKKLPCLIFKSTSQSEEAGRFVVLNGNRRPVNSYEKYRALLTAGNEIAVFVDGVVRSIGREVSMADSHTSVRCVGRLILEATKNKNSLEKALRCASDICGRNHQISEKIIKGLVYIDQYCETSLDDETLFNRITATGFNKISDGIEKNILARGIATSKICAEGILSAVNMRLHNKYELKTA